MTTMLEEIQRMQAQEDYYNSQQQQYNPTALDIINNPSLQFQQQQYPQQYPQQQYLQQYPPQPYPPQPYPPQQYPPQYSQPVDPNQVTVTVKESRKEERIVKPSAVNSTYKESSSDADNCLCACCSCIFIFIVGFFSCFGKICECCFEILQSICEGLYQCVEGICECFGEVLRECCGCLCY